MKINEMLEEVLEEAKKKVRSRYGCLMLYLNIDKKDWSELQDIIDEKDIYYDKKDSSFGRETEPHLTILYGFHSDINYEEFEKEIKKIKEPVIRIKGVSAFNNENYSVLKFDIESKDLNKLNENFKKFPHTNDYPDYNPHITIAYLKPDKVNKYLESIEKNKNIPFSVDKIVYSKANGNKMNYDI